MDIVRAYLFDVLAFYNKNPVIKICLEQYLEVEKEAPHEVFFSKTSWKIVRISWQVKLFLEGKEWPEKIKYLPKLEEEFQDWLKSQFLLSPITEERLRNAFFRWKVASRLKAYLDKAIIQQFTKEFTDAMALANQN